MEVYTCFCRDELCNDNSFLLPKFNEWISVTRARLKAGASHPLDVVTSIATFGIAGFFCLVVISNLPWRKMLGKPIEEVQEEDSDDEDISEASNANHTKED